jgi:hypothetical protein
MNDRDQEDLRGMPSGLRTVSQDAAVLVRLAAPTGSATAAIGLGLKQSPSEAKKIPTPRALWRRARGHRHDHRAQRGQGGL